MSDICPNPTSLRKQIRIFRADSMIHTPFDETGPRPELLSAGIAFVDHPEKADLIIVRRARFLKDVGKYDKAFAIWTHEPRLSVHSQPIVRIAGVRNAVYVMNALTGNIYTDEFFGFSSAEIDFDTAMACFATKPRRAVMLASYRRPLRSSERAAADLTLYRQGLALHLQRLDFCDIYGRHWPDDVKVLGNSRVGNWRAAKAEILKGYAVNLAFENNIVPQYITEKIWDAVINACLPVYHGAQNGVYRVFPEGSFIEAAGKSVEELGDEILAMSQPEMAERYEACLRAYLKICRKNRRKISRHACALRTIEFLRNAVAAHESKGRSPAAIWTRLAARLRAKARRDDDVRRRL